MANSGSRLSFNRPLTVQESILEARHLLHEDVWVVNNYNCLAALWALAEKQPAELYLIARDDAEEDMPLEFFQEISTRAKGCRISMRFVDSFLKPCGTITDRRRMEIMVANKSFTFERFYGYLDGEVINNPMMATVVSCGLAIKNAADAALVSSLKFQSMNKALHHFNISVSSEVDIGELKPIHDSFDGHLVYLTFPYLTDDCVNNVRPAIDKLMPGRGVAGLFFPRSRVTGAGARRLVSQLAGACVHEVSIEPCETWKEDDKERESIEEILERVGVKKENVEWNMDWMYKQSRNYHG